jgi:hypothetical protein
LSAQGGDGGEGGERGEAGHAAAVQSNREVLVVLAQMQGHLLVAEELLSQRQFLAAEPHVGHPVDELYGALGPALQRRGISPFLPTLEALRQQVRLNPNSPETALKLAKAQQGVAAVSRAVNHEAPTPAVVVVAVVRQLGEITVSEYAAAVAGDQVVEVIEYQKASGVLLEAQRLLAQANAAHPSARADVTARQQALIQSWQAIR